MTANTEIRVKAGGAVNVKVTGPAVVRITRPGADQAGEQHASLAGLSEAVSLLTARHHGIDSPGLSGDVPPAAVASALVILGGAFLASLLPVDNGARLLRDLGAVAAGEDDTTTGEDPAS